MKIFAFTLIFAALLLRTVSISGQAAAITIDGKFDDWNSNLATFIDGEDNPEGIDLWDFQVTNDDKYLFVEFSLNTDICLANSFVPHQIWLCLDTDNNPDTGYPQQTGYGSELAIDFNEHYAWFNVPDPNIKVSLDSIGLVSLPTVTASTFELAIPRDVRPDGINPIFFGDTIRVLIKDNKDHDKMPDEGKVFYYVFDNTLKSPEFHQDLHKDKPENIRVINYNLHHNNGWESESLSNMQSVFTVLNGDIYCFQESKTTSAEDTKSYMDTWLPTGTAEGWHVAKKGDRVTCSRWPIIQTWHLWNKLATLIDLPDSYPKDLLVINAHLTCCGGNEKRQEQADEFASFVLDAKTPGDSIDLPENIPIIFAGDMNLVGYAQQRETIITGDIQDTTTYGQGGPLDWDNTDLADARPLHADRRMAFTWRAFKDFDYPPGRLDYQFFTDAVLKMEKGFVLQTEEMSAERLADYGLNIEDTKMVSDHLPVTVDYSFKNSTGIEQSSTKSMGLRVYPNPASTFLTIKTPGRLTSTVLWDILGRKVVSFSRNQKHFQVRNLAKGIYFLDMRIDGKRVLRKIMVLH